MIDSDGYRFNVGIILTNARYQVLLARRVGQDAWQFPQGGMKTHETPEQALFRELHEEVGLAPDHVQILATSAQWLRYQLPRNLVRRHRKPVCIGQKQRWFLLRLVAAESCIRLDIGQRPEFDHWRWVDYWQPVDEVVDFKRDVYRRALSEFEPLINIPDHESD